MRRYLVPFAGVALLLVLLFGCGGGHGNAGGTGGGGTLTDATRAAALEAAGTKFAALKSLAPAAANQQMADYLGKQPLFEAAGVSEDGCAWGRFKDGRTAIFINNRRTPTKPLAAQSLLPTRSADVPSNLPVDSNVFLFDGMGTDWSNAQDIYTTWFQNKGYTPRWGAYPANLDNVLNDGLFYVDAHGGSGKWRDGSRAFGVWTKQQQSPAADTLLKDDLDNHRLNYMYADAHLDADGKWVPEWHYAFTARYVLDKMAFGQNSLVFINACSSDEPVFRAACLAKGASVYAGWSNPVDNDKALKASDMLFDRMLGQNLNPPVASPKQRPFDWKSLYAWMQSNGYDIGAAAGGCYLKMTQNPATASPIGVFAPSIAFMSAHPVDQKLYVWGLFGDDPSTEGKISVGGADAQVLEWTYDAQVKMDRITCKLPFEGAGSSGDVKVTVRKHESNVRQLSLYAGDFTLTHDTGDGRKYESVHFLRFRVDLQSLRLKPGESPQFSPMNPQRVFADDHSFADYEFSGSTLLEDGKTLAWNGKDHQKNNINGDGNTRGFVASIKFDPENHQALLTLTGSMKDGLIQTVTDTNGNSSSFTTTVIYGLDLFDGTDTAYASDAIIHLDSNDNIPKGSSTAKTIQTLYGAQPGTDTVKIEWNTIQCESPPKSDTERAAKSLTSATRR